MTARTEVLIEARIDATVHAKAGAVLASHGMTIADAVELWLTQTAQAGEIAPVLPATDAASTIDDPGDEYDGWFRAQVQEALDDPRPNIPDIEVRARFAERREELRKRGSIQ